MQKVLAKIISIVLHPLLMPTFGLFIIFNSETYLSYMPYEAQRIIYAVVFITTFISPLCLIPFFLYQKLIKNVQMANNKERVIPLFITVLFYYFAYFILGKFSVPQIIHTFMLSSVIAVTLTLFITIKWKISAHMLGIGGLTGVVIALSIRLMADLQTMLVILIFFSGLLGYARLRLNAHKPSQIYSGFGLGFVIVLVTILVF